MSDRRQQDTLAHEQWSFEQCIKDMERDVVRGNALQKILAAEAAAKLTSTKQENDDGL